MSNLPLLKSMIFIIAFRRDNFNLGRLNMNITKPFNLFRAESRKNKAEITELILLKKALNMTQYLNLGLLLIFCKTFRVRDKS